MAKMTIRECMDAAYQLVNQYSIAGSLVPLSYNAQADDELRMINLINDAQMQIATVKPIGESLTFEVPPVEAHKPVTELECPMPEYFIEATLITFIPARGGVRVSKNASYYHWTNDDVLLVPDRPAGTYRVEFNRYPARYAPDVDKNTPLDNTPDTHFAIPYYVAAMLSVDENPKTYYACYNVWETRLSRLGYKQPHAENGFVDDVYGLNHYWSPWG